VATDGGCNWMDHTFSERNHNNFIMPVGKRQKSRIVKWHPVGHRRCNGINDVERCRELVPGLPQSAPILQQTMVPNNHTVFEYWSDDGDIPVDKLVSRKASPL